MSNTINFADAMWDIVVDYEHLRTRTMQLRSFADVFCQRYADTADANKAAAIVREDYDNFTNLALLLYDLIHETRICSSSINTSARPDSAAYARAYLRMM